ncbi:hypothetical protein J1N35_035214 [Gossypium stocksii]|uniref:Peptidase M16 N-terminal domain-containing protein n=1 Tax=Gossypium stocksii TaxID=47602 RepID=A0A9D3UUC4_9ROSI|nr:hypothetical protein J1N35_035214 [Gossypium stocksii]
MLTVVQSTSHQPYFGVSQLLERMAFKSTTSCSHLSIVKEVEAIGDVQATRSAQNYRLIMYRGQCSHFVPTAINVAIKELISVATRGQVDWKYLDHDKQSTKWLLQKTSLSKSRHMVRGRLFTRFLSFLYCKGYDTATIDVPSYDSISSKFK